MRWPERAVRAILDGSNLHEVDLMPDITTNNPPDPAALAALLEIQKSTRETQGSTQNLRGPLERLIEAVKEITKR